MALLNFGITPAAASGGNELAAVTRRAVMPAVVVQLGKSTVTLSSLLAAAEPVSGGVSPVTIPVQGTRMVSGAWADYSGSFAAPQTLPGLSNAEYNLKAFVVGVPYYLFEGMIQQDAEIVNIAWARMNDAGNYISDQIATKIFTALSANTSLMPFSLYDIFATTDPTQGAVGNIARASNTWWQANVATIASINSSSQAWGRTNGLASVVSAQKAGQGEPPSCGIVSPGAWMAIAADFVGSERYNVNPEGTYGDAAEGATTYFPAINVGGIPFYADLYQTDNTLCLMPNFNYLQFKIHQDAAFAIAGPESLLPQFQLGYVMAIFVLLELVCSKPVAQTQITGLTGAFTP